MPAIPYVSITLVDGGVSASLSVPQSKVQLKIGCTIGGAVNQPYATAGAENLQTQFVGGPGVEAGGLICQAGNICVFVACPIATKGAKLSGTSATVKNAANVGTAVITTTLDALNGAWDTYYFKIVCTQAGTIGTAPGPGVTVSRDAGRNSGSQLLLGAATFLDLGAPLNTNAVLPMTTGSQIPGGSGVELNFTGGQTMAVGDSWTFATVAPQFNDAGFTAAFAAFSASQYAVQGVGSSHLVGVLPINGGSGDSDIVAVQTAMPTLTTQQVYARCIVDL